MDMQAIRRKHPFLGRMADLADKAKQRNAAKGDPRMAEPMTQREFVRHFGSKVKKVRYTDARDFVGLMVVGTRMGFTIVRHKDHRRIRIVVMEDGRWAPTKVYIPLRDKDSASYMWRGLLRYVA